VFFPVFPGKFGVTPLRSETCHTWLEMEKENVRSPWDMRRERNSLSLGWAGEKDEDRGQWLVWEVT
jgi:hypothetical protein